MDYKKTLETVKLMVEHGQISQETAERYFPELAESEDERIRKAIHIYLDWLDGRKDCAPKGEYSIKYMIAWLEKQGGEQKPAWSEEDEKILNLIIARLHSHPNVESKEYDKDYYWLIKKLRGIRV